jgi:drug/metabolite transporter (DMT)-like permease
LPLQTARSVFRIKLLAAFAAVYFVWGSTYLFIHFALEELPPFVLAATRFLIAGTILFTWSRLHDAPAPRRQEWKAALITGGLFFLCGNGAVVWSQQRLPSGIAALLVAIVPLWVVLLEWARPPHPRPPRLVLVGVAVGLAGLVLLVGPSALTRGGPIHPGAALVLAGGSLCWAYGTLVAQRATLPRSPFLAASMQLLAGGALLTMVAITSGEPARTPWSSLSFVTIASMLYLIVFGSILAFTAYGWLVRVVPASRLATYAYVNPVVAMILGWLFAGEKLAFRTLVAAAVVLAGVALITIGSTRPSAAPAEPQSAMDSPEPPNRLAV